MTVVGAGAGIVVVGINIRLGFEVPENEESGESCREEDENDPKGTHSVCFSLSLSTKFEVFRERKF